MIYYSVCLYPQRKCTKLHIITIMYDVKDVSASVCLQLNTVSKVQIYTTNNPMVKKVVVVEYRK